MEQLNRTQYSFRNIIFGLGGQCIETVLKFISRTIFIRFLAVEYLGLNSLFTEILTVLSLAELGIGNAIIFALYKPLRDKDEGKVASLMKFYKAAYKIIGTFIGVTGLLIMPFLKYIVDMPDNLDVNMYVIYCLFLFNTSVSYFFSFKTTLLGADQKNYISQSINIICSIIRTSLQIIVLAVSRNFYLYLIVQVLMTVVSNFTISKYVDKKYAYINSKEIESIDKNIKKELVTNVKALVVIKVGSIIVNSTDNIIISALNGLKSVGLMANYTMFTSVFEKFLGQIFDSLTGSIGNLNAQGDLKKSEEFFKVLNLLNFWLFGWVAVAIIVLANPTIEIWLGKNYILSQLIVIIMAVNFYIKGMQNAVWTYKNTYGLFRYGKYILQLTAILNLILSIVLGKVMGLSGVLIATAISRLCVNVWYEPYVVFRYGLKKQKNWFAYNYIYIRYAIVLILSAFLTFEIGSLIQLTMIENKFVIWFYKALCVLIIPNIVNYIYSRNRVEFVYLKEKIAYILKGKKS